MKKRILATLMVCLSVSACGFKYVTEIGQAIDWGCKVWSEVIRTGEEAARDGSSEEEIANLMLARRDEMLAESAEEFGFAGPPSSDLLPPLDDDYLIGLATELSAQIEISLAIPPAASESGPSSPSAGRR